MTTSHSTDACLPLMEACTLELYNQNIFRITGLPVDATPKQIARQAQKLQMLEEMGGGATGAEAAFALPTPPTSEDIRGALARMKDPQRRLVDEFFWFWPESDFTGSTDPAILAVAAGDADEAVKLWWTREQEGSEIAKHNLAVMYHMSAVDWTLHQFSYEIDHEREDKVKAYWQEAFDRWETLVESTEVRDVLKKRVREIDDEALTTGFVRRFLRELPKGFDQVNAHAALKLAEQNRMDWARFHVEFMRQTHQGLDDVDTTAQMVLEPTKRRVEAHLKSFREKARATPEQGASLAANLLEQCRPMINLFDLFHGQEAHQRNDVFDRVAETILGMVIDHQRSTGDNRAFVGLLRDVLGLASGTQLRERIIKNISIGEGNLEIEAAERKRSTCHFCGSGGTGPESIFELAMYGDVVRYGNRVEYKKLSVPVPRCKACAARHQAFDKAGCSIAVGLIIIGGIIGGINEGVGGLIGGLVGGAFVTAILYNIIDPILASASGQNKAKSHPEVKKMRASGWKIGNSPGRYG